MRADDDEAREPLRDSARGLFETDRTALVLLVALLTVLAGCTALTTGDPPTLTVDNRDETRYRLTVFALSTVDDPSDVTVRATTGAGDRRSVGLADLKSGAPYRNVTLPAGADGSHQLAVPAASNTTTTVDAWDRGDAWGYVLERTDDESVVGVDVVTCERGGQRASVTIADGYERRSSRRCS
jgi:hypothetical protein